MTFTCIRFADCGATRNEPIPVPGHDYITIRIEATCKKEGSITVTCKNCDYEDITVIPILTYCGCEDCSGNVRVTGATSAKFISITPINGKANDTIRIVKFSVNVTLSNETSEVRIYSIEIRSNNNNPDGKFVFAAGHDLEGFTLVYDIKGNGSNIKTFSISKQP